MSNQIYQYYPNKDMDYALLQWLERMRHDGELNKTFAKSHHTPSIFLQFFQQPRQLFFQLDSLGNISLACWFEPCMGSMFLSYYSSPNYRNNREVAHFIFDCFNYIFEAGIPTICGLIQDRCDQVTTRKFIELHCKMGYTYRGSLPRFFDGIDCHLVTLTAEDWHNPKSNYLINAQRRWKEHRLEKAAQGGSV